MFIGRSVLLPCVFIGRSVPTPCVFIGDDRFSLQSNLMKPFSRKNLDLFTRTGNYHRFSRARHISENVLGIITNPWRIYRSPISLHREQVREITMAVLTLHNWLQGGRSKTFHRQLGFCDTYDPKTQSFIPGSWRKKQS